MVKGTHRRTAETTTTFDATQYELNYPDGVERHYWHRARNAVLERVLRQEGLATSALLEIGCGRGFVTGALRDAGFSCLGVELAPAAATRHAAPFVRTGVSFDDLPESERLEVRGALLLDVLEHVEEPVDFLRRIRRALPFLQRLVLTVPARTELWSRWDEFYGHRCRYHRESLRAELEAAGYVVRSSRYFFHALYPMAWAINAVGATRSTQVFAPHPRSLLHRVVGRCFAAEARLLPAALPGTSLLAVASPR